MQFVDSTNELSSGGGRDCLETLDSFCAVQNCKSV